MGHHISEVLGFVLGVVILAATSSTLKYIHGAKGLDQDKRNLILLVNGVGVAASSLLIAAMLFMWFNDWRVFKGKSVVGSSANARLARILRPVPARA